VQTPTSVGSGARGTTPLRSDGRRLSAPVPWDQLPDLVGATPLHSTHKPRPLDLLAETAVLPLRKPGSATLSRTQSESIGIRFGNGAYGVPLITRASTASTLRPTTSPTSPASTLGSRTVTPGMPRRPSQLFLTPGSAGSRSALSSSAALSRLERQLKAQELSTPRAKEELPPLAARAAPAEAVARYAGCRAIREAIECQAVALVKASWLIKLSGAGGRLPRRQEVPQEVMWSADELFDGDSIRRGNEIIAVSHSWLTQEHPDPAGLQLQALAEYIVAWTRIRPGLILPRIAVFLDWCSLTQEPRSEADSALFERAQEYAAIWYAHRLVRVFLLTAMPKGAATDTLPYDKRGWPAFEMALANLNVLRGGEVLDFGRVESGARHQERGWPETEAAMGALVDANSRALDSTTMGICAFPRRPPFSPKGFEKALLEKTFSNLTDHDLVARLYEEAFEAVAGSTERLDLSDMSWGDAEVDKLAEALPGYTRLEELNLSRNRITDLGAGNLAPAIPRCTSLKRLFLTENEIEIGFDGADRLREAWQAAKKDEFWLFLAYPAHCSYVKQMAGLD